jgi:hypothetical protein
MLARLAPHDKPDLGSGRLPNVIGGPGSDCTCAVAFWWQLLAVAKKPINVSPEVLETARRRQK